MQAKKAQSQASKPQSQASRNFDIIFENVSHYSKEYNIPLESCFISVLTNTKPFQLHKQDLDDASLGEALQKGLETDSGSNDEEERTAYKVWVTCGETGMGKSSFINALLDEEIAEEAQQVSESQTSDVSVYGDPEKKLCLIDTPGLCDTRPDMSDKQILDQICAQVERTLRIESKIDALILFWSPNVAIKFRQSIIEQLKTMFGTDVLKSIVLVVNKYSDLWKRDKRCEAASKEVSNQVKKLCPELPIVEVDLKAINSDDLFETICNEVAEVKPFNEKYFLKIRRDACWQIYQHYLQRLIEDEELAERIGREYQKKFTKEQQRHQAEMDNLTTSMNNLGLQVDKQRKVISSQENETRKLLEENKRLGSDLQQQKRDLADQQSRHNQKINEINRTIESQKQEVNALSQQNRTLQNRASTPSFTFAPNYTVPTYTPSYSYSGGGGRCWGCGGGPGHTWSYDCTGGY